VTTGDDEQTSADQRLVAAMKKLDVFSRIDADGRILASDGEQEYEVTVDLGRLLTADSGGFSRRIRVGKSSLARLEGGDVSALFSRGVTLSTAEPDDTAAYECPVSPYYGDLDGMRTRTISTTTMR
jgi:hypothetical protein